MEQVLSLKQQIANVWKLSVPAILTQISSIVMQYIDSAMVGNLGEEASAAIGLISTSTWLLGGLVSAVSVGFSVQVAHAFGANKFKEGRNILRHGLITAIIFSLILMIIGLVICEPLPMWLKGDKSIWQDATYYFLVFVITLPFMQLNSLTSSVLQCSGNMIVPSLLNTLMCLLDVVFNAIFIPKYGVLGAGIGTGLATTVVSIIMIIVCCFGSKKLSIINKDHCKFDKIILSKALKIGTPVGLEQVAMCGAMVVSTMIVAPLGNVSIAAHSFAITAESLCYMPGYGMAAAATTLVGQQIGAKHFKMAKKYANISVIFGTILMSLMAIIMFILCPFVFKILTPVEEVRTLATTILRIGLIAEPLYAVSIVASGALRGAEDTLVPSILNLTSIWIVRIGLSIILVGSLGLIGVWIAMASELSVRGILLLIRQQTSKYYFKNAKNETLIEEE
ncbi:MAG: MATE family efflux transporter [Bacilli bacterium]|nr:MATE family efflux transporter [Bacilli bacterium]